MKRTKRNLRRYRPVGFYIFGRRVNLRSFVPFVAFLIVFVVSASLLLNYCVNSAKRKKENAMLTSEYESAFFEETAETLPSPAVEIAPEPTTTPKPQILDSYRAEIGEIPMKAWELYQQNNDLVGWLYIKGVVSLPVVYRDNEFYLNHNYNQEPDDGGTLFLDQYHPLKSSTQNLLIHGHNMYDSSMFGIVSNYNKLSNVKGHAFARFSSLYENEHYVICAVLRVSTSAGSADYFNYVGHAKFSDADDFYAYVNELKRRSLFKIPIDIEPSDAMLSLATCVDDDRLLVVFRRLRPGETKEELQELVNQSIRQ